MDGVNNLKTYQIFYSFEWLGKSANMKNCSTASRKLLGKMLTLIEQASWSDRKTPDTIKMVFSS